MATLLLDHLQFGPAKAEVAHGSSTHDSKEEPGIEVHDNQHQKVAQNHLHNLKSGLSNVGEAKYQRLLGGSGVFRLVILEVQ